MLKIWFWLLVATYLPSVAQDELVTGPRPLRMAADRLQAVWARPVTYEEPLWVHASDISAEGDPVLRWNGLRVRRVTIPQGVLGNHDRGRDLAQVRVILAAFNREYAPLQFAAIESGWGLHIVPRAMKDRNGTGAAASSLLDEAVTVPAGERTPMGHVRALATALGQAKGVRVEGSSGVLGFGVDQLFGQAGSDPRFVWGTAGVVKGRDALVDLLSRSATSLSWRLNCQPATTGVTDAYCVLNVDPMRLEVRRDGRTAMEVLSWDRCVRCKPLPPPAPPLPKD